MMHVVSITEIAQEKLKAEDKKQNMTRKDVKLYNEALSESALLQPRGSAYTIDLHAITKGTFPLYQSNFITCILAGVRLFHVSFSCRRLHNVTHINNFTDLPCFNAER